MMMLMEMNDLIYVFQNNQYFFISYCSYYFNSTISLLDFKFLAISINKKCDVNLGGALLLQTNICYFCYHLPERCIVIIKRGRMWNHVLQVIIQGISLKYGHTFDDDKQSLMITTEFKRKVVKDASRSIGFDKLDSLMMAPKWSLAQALSQIKAQASVYKIGSI